MPGPALAPERAACVTVHGPGVPPMFFLVWKVNVCVVSPSFAAAFCLPFSAVGGVMKVCVRFLPFCSFIKDKMKKKFIYQRGW